MYLTGFSVKWCEVVQSGVNIRLVVIFTYGRTLGWSQNPLPVGQRLKTVYECMLFCYGNLIIGGLYRSGSDMFNFRGYYFY